MPPLVLAGSLGVLWGALIVTIGMSESYDGLLAWRKGTQAVGTLVASIGTAAAFTGATIGDVSKADAKILPWGLALLSLTVLVGLLLPRFHRWREKGQGPGPQGRESTAVAAAKGSAGVASAGGQASKRRLWPLVLLAAAGLLAARGRGHKGNDD